MIEVQPAEKPKKLFLTKSPQLAIHLVVDPFEVLDTFLTLEMLLREKCTVTQIECTITLTGSSVNLLHVLALLGKVFSPNYLNIDPYEKAEAEAELIGLQPKKTQGFFSLSAKWTGKPDETTKTKKKSSSAERRRSSNQLVELRRASAPSPTDSDTITQPHNTSPTSPVIKKK